MVIFNVVFHQFLNFLLILNHVYCKKYLKLAKSYFLFVYLGIYCLGMILLFIVKKYAKA